MQYHEAGVDVAKGDAFVKKISTFIQSTYDSRVIAGVGGFAALYDMNDRYLAVGTDGVGTKVKLAQELNLHHTIGQDLVAMCVNDVLCTGARPLFFLDYFATAKLDLEIHTELVKGIVAACKISGCALIGGETAEMPGLYEAGVYDLAGFCVGEVSKEKCLHADLVKPGQWLIGLPSSGFHSNGFSLIRKLVKPEELNLKRKLLTPTTIYVSLIQELLNSLPGSVAGLAHITGGGFSNIARMNKNLNFQIDQYPTDSWRPEFMNEILRRVDSPDGDLYQTFNMGIGMVLSVVDLENVQAYFKKKNQPTFLLGRVTN